MSRSRMLQSEAMCVACCSARLELHICGVILFFCAMLLLFRAVPVPFGIFCVLRCGPRCEETNLEFNSRRCRLRDVCGHSLEAQFHQR